MDARFRVYFGELTYFVSNEQILWNAPTSLQTFPVLKKCPKIASFFKKKKFFVATFQGKGPISIRSYSFVFTALPVLR